MRQSNDPWWGFRDVAVALWFAAAAAVLLWPIVTDGQPAIKQIGFVLLPADGAVHFGAGPNAVTVPGFFETVVDFGTPAGARTLVDAGGVKVTIAAGLVVAELETSGGRVFLEDLLGVSGAVGFSWDASTAWLEVGGSRISLPLPGVPTPNLGSLTAGLGGGDPVALTRWRIGAPSLFADGFESGGFCGWESACGGGSCPFEPPDEPEPEFE